MVSILIAALSGLLLWSGFAPLELWFGPYLGIALLFRTLCEKSLKQRLLNSLIAGLSFFLALLHWSSVYVGAIPWIILAVGEALIFALIAIPRWSQHWKSALAFALLFTLIELLRMKVPFGGFGWGRLGFTQIDSMNLLYPLIGVTGVSLLISLAALAIASPKRLTIVFSILIVGFISMSHTVPKVEEDSYIQITAIQGGVDNLGVDFNKRAMRVLQRHIQATKNVMGTALYIWPENAADIDPLKNEKAHTLIKELVKSLDAPLLLGAVEDSAAGPTNSSLLFSHNGELQSRYVKQDLAPFGEYMPLRNMAEAISPYATRVNDFQPGERWVKHSVKGIPFQSLVCFEVLDDDHAKSGAMGSAFMVAQTNNATFGKSSEAAQQLQITRARAAESGRDFAVVSTTGFTAHLNSQGKILDIAPQFTPETLTMKLQLVDPWKKTLAQRIDTATWILLLGLTFGLSRVKLSR